MIKKLALIASALAILAVAPAAVTPASAQGINVRIGDGHRHHDRGFHRGFHRDRIIVREHHHDRGFHRGHRGAIIVR